MKGAGSVSSDGDAGGVKRLALFFLLTACEPAGDPTLVGDEVLREGGGGGGGLRGDRKNDIRSKGGRTGQRV